MSMAQATLDYAVADVTRSVPRFVNGNGTVYKYSYGTAGFRDVADRLPSAMVRVGILAALESKFFGGKPVGVVVTASHNQGSDNGAKIMDCHGEMMAQSWEDFASDLANAAEGDDVVKLVKSFAEKLKIDLTSSSIVFAGRDTRLSSPTLRDCVVKGVLAMGGQVFDHGQVTTPQLHWIVRAFNQNPSLFDPLTITDRHDLEKYNLNIGDALSQLLDGTVPTLTVDCANGIGAVALKNIQKYISRYIPVVLMNTAIDDPAKLNHKVGAEHVQKNRQLPEGVNPDTDILKKFASIDGDADRVVYFYVNREKKLSLLDGDKIIALIATYLQKLIKEANLNIRIGVVQTAYANGAATKYLQTVIGVPVACVATGVKFLHHKATEFDIGIYFEANGHGTVLFSSESINKISSVAADKSNATAHKSASRLLALNKLINQAVGDAISDIMLIEVILASLKMGLEDWNKFYADLPSCQSKVKVHDRKVVVTTDAERRVSSPPSLQSAIDQAVAKVQCGRAFVRPSGTEDVIRTYAEAATEAEAKLLSDLVVKAVYEHAGGI